MSVCDFRAVAYTQISKYDEAMMDCRKSIEIDPNYAKAYSRHGLVFYALGKYKEAIVQFLKGSIVLNLIFHAINEYSKLIIGAYMVIPYVWNLKLLNLSMIEFSSG